MDRDKILNVRLSAEEQAQAHELAKDAGISLSDWVRLTIRDAYKRLQKETPKKRRTA